MPLCVSLEPQKRHYEIAKGGRLHSWGMFSSSADTEIKGALRVARSKSRWLFENNDYFKQFLRLLKVNVVGPDGIRLQVKAKTAKGELDRENNSLIEEEFAEWGKPGNCDVTGKLSWDDCCNLYIETLARDGEVLVRMIEGFPNRWGFALQFIEADQLDETFNKQLPNGNKIRMSVELDQWDRPLAYWVLKNHPGDTGTASSTWGNKYQQIPAREIIHEYVIERPRQTRGMPWSHTAARRLGQVDGLEEAVVVGARVGASKMGFFTSKDGEPGAEEFEGEYDEKGELVQEAEPATFTRLPHNIDFKEFNPGFPAGEIEPLLKEMLRGTAVGLGTQYHSLTGDLTDVNFSSIRAGTLSERDAYKVIRAGVSLRFCTRVSGAWLRMALLNSQIGSLSLIRYDHFNKPTWSKRSWDWVSPKDDMVAEFMALKYKTKTFTRLLADKGIDINDHIEELKNDKALFEKAGIDIEAILKGGTANASATKQ